MMLWGLIYGMLWERGRSLGFIVEGDFVLYMFELKNCMIYYNFFLIIKVLYFINVLFFES